MGSWGADLLIDAVIKWFVGIVVEALDLLWGLLSASVLRSPDVTQLPQVQSFAGTSLGIVNVAYVLAFLWMAIIVMGRDTIQSRYGPGELIPRLIIGLILANFAIPLCSTIIGLANAVTEAFTSDPITSEGTLDFLKRTSTGTINSYTVANTPKAFVIVLIALIVAVLVALLFIQWIIRLAVLIVVVAISPIALALHATPHTEAAAKLWWRALLGTLGTVVIQAVALHTTLKVFLAPGDNLTVLGLPGIHGAGEPAAVVNLLIVVCMLLGVLKVPGLMRRYITKGSPSQAGTIMRVMFIQQLTRGLSRGSSSARGVGRGGGGTAAARRGDPPWPVTTPGGGQRSLARPAATRTTRSPSTPTRMPPPRPAGAGPDVVAVASPTGRPIRPYTRDELARGVDVYTRSLKTRRAAGTSGGTRS